MHLCAIMMINEKGSEFTKKIKRLKGYKSLPESSTAGSYIESSTRTSSSDKTNDTFPDLPVLFSFPEKRKYERGYRSILGLF